MLEQAVTSLQQKVQSLEQKGISKHTRDSSALQLKVNTVNASCSICQNNLGDLESKFKDLELNYTLLKDENQILSQDVANMRQNQSVGSIANLNKQVQATTNRVNQLEFTNMVMKQEIVTISNITHRNTLDVTTIGQNITRLFTSVEREFREQTRNDTVIKRLTDALDLKIASLETNVTVMNTQLASFTHYTCYSQPVAFTAWNEGWNVTSDRVIKFNKVKTSTGVSNLLAVHSTGTVTVEVDGLYIIALTVNSDTNGSAFEIYKNSIPLSQV